MDAAVSGKAERWRWAAGGRRCTVDKNGRVLVPGDYVRRLGDGDFKRGKRLLDQVINDIRRRLVSMAARRAVAAQR